MPRYRSELCNTYFQNGVTRLAPEAAAEPDPAVAQFGWVAHLGCVRNPWLRASKRFSYIELYTLTSAITSGILVRHSPCQVQHLPGV